MSIQGNARVSTEQYQVETNKLSSTDNKSNNTGAEAALDIAEVNPISRIHSFRGRVRLFGHYFPAQFLVLSLIEYLAFACVPIVTLPLLEGAMFSGATIAHHWPESLFFSLVLIISIASMGLYDGRQREGLKSIMVRLAAAFTMGLGSLLVMIAIVPGFSFDFASASLFVGISYIYALVFRIYFYRYVDGNVLVRKIIVLGSGKRAQSIERLRRKSDQRGFDLVGFVQGQGEGPVRVDATRLILTDKSLRDYSVEHRIDEIVIATDDRRGKLPLDDLLDCRMSGINVIEMLDFFERETEKIRLDLLRPSWLIYADGFKRNLMRSFSKRLFDILMSSMILIICSPLILLTALAILIESGGRGPVLYNQERVGKNGKCFKLRKFRSMRTDAEQDGIARWADKGDSRVTRVGSFIRKYRLDELPQIWNILVNDMSLVGPRPERPEFVEQLVKENPLYRERHRVTPGLAGWAQVSYPYGASIKDSIEKLQYDLYYVKNHGVLFDFYILVQTAEVVLFNKGVR